MFSELHTPVLFEEVKKYFTEQSFVGPTVVDCTLGLGGHSSLFLGAMQNGTLVAFDRDGENLARAKDFLEYSKNGNTLYFVSNSFASLEQELESLSIGEVDCVLYDLGVSSVHYDDPLRGFSIRDDGPLDMRFDRSHGKTAQDMVMTLDARELARIFTLYGEEKKSWFIAQAIVQSRNEGVIDTTRKLLNIIEASSFDKKSSIRVFQALRIAVNEEFQHIESSLAQALAHLKVGGIIMVITFHSLEDRLVKQFFSPYLEDTIDDVTGQIKEKAHFRKYTKKPVEPTPGELENNPRSRSAKMRIIQRVY